MTKFETYVTTVENLIKNYTKKLILNFLDFQ